MPSVSQLYDLALQHHQAGQLRQAEVLYRQVLQADPRHAGALGLFGLLAYQVGRSDLAVDYIQQALRLRPEFHTAHNNLGIALQDQGKLEEAITSYRHAVRLKPDYAEAHCNLADALRKQGQLDEAIITCRHALRLKPDFAEAYNNLGNALREQRKLDEAIANYRQALRLKPDHAEAYLNLGLALKDQGKVAEAISNYQEVLRRQPDHIEAYLNLGLALKGQGKVAEAISNYQEVLRRQPDHAAAHNNLGNILKDQGRLEEAVAHYRQALLRNPDFAKGYNNLALALQDQGQLEEAIANYQQALRLEPQLAMAYTNLGNAQEKLGRLDEAITSYQQALHCQPDDPDVHNNLGIALRGQGKLDEAITSFRHALVLNPDCARAHSNLGNALNDQGRLEEAVAHYQQALRLQPDYAEATNNLGSALRHQGRLDEALAAYRAGLAIKADGAGIHSNLVYAMNFHPVYDAATILAECRCWEQQHAASLAMFIRPFDNRPDPERRLRIGYVSPDFRRHAVSLFMMPLLSNHDHRQVEIFCYADVARPDDMTERLRAHADVWRPTVGLNDEQLAGMVRNDRIDILVDLTLHMAKNRLLVFARKPAPVQVSWLGYAGTTGLTTIDYRLTDPYLDPPGADDSCYSEQSIRLPETFWCYDPMTDQPPVQDLPALANGFFTFGCLNTFCKVNDGTLLLWARVLRAVSGSRLLLLAPAGQARDRVLSILRQEGIEGGRVEFADRQSYQRYLQQYNRMDLGLDPLPYNGGTTSLDAFWMGVPTITQIGRTVVGRAGWSLLSNLGLQELAARTPDEFVAIAADLANDLPRLRELRQTLRPRMVRSPLMDAPRFAHNMEQAYRQMWHSWCRAAGQGSDSVGEVLP